MFDGIPWLAWLAYVTPFVYLLGAFAAVDSLLQTRTPQGTVAWVLALLLLPYVSLPLYLVFGRNKFNGYVEARRAGNRAIQHVAHDLRARLEPFHVAPPEIREPGDLLAVERLVHLPMTRGNHVELLINGDKTFEAMLDEISRAERYLLLQYYILRDDEIGRRVRDALIERARAGVAVRVLYDEIGSHELPDRYVEQLRAAGVIVSGFRTTRGIWNRFQLNFRNHRKIFIRDGRIAIVGGMNIGDEYCGKHPRLTPWRDTNVWIEGPAVQCVQLAFVEDWFWATDESPDLDWEPQPSPRANLPVLILPTGPTDLLETCSLLFTHAIHSARERVWIASPYFVPDARVIGALQLAALRGVDTRVIVSGKLNDARVAELAALPVLAEVAQAGVRVYRYECGCLHEKVFLIDQVGSAVGTANLDNRSERLNFEITALVADGEFAAKTAAMLERDMSDSREKTLEELRDVKLVVHILSRGARLLSPIL